MTLLAQRNQRQEDLNREKEGELPAPIQVQKDIPHPTTNNFTITQTPMLASDDSMESKLEKHLVKYARASRMKALEDQITSLQARFTKMDDIPTKHEAMCKEHTKALGQLTKVKQQVFQKLSNFQAELKRQN